MSKSKQPTATDAVAILRQRYVDGKPGMAALVEVEKANAIIAQAIYDLRTRLRLTQRSFAKRVQTTPSVICQLESTQYQGHSVRMLERIAHATGQRLEMKVCFVPQAAHHKPKVKGYQHLATQP